jgi:diphthamide synthase (EF-2-diphthine--ammonia ligase)
MSGQTSQRSRARSDARARLPRGYVRNYRTERPADGRRVPFLLWDRNRGELARGSIAARSEALIVCLDPLVLDTSFALRRYDEQLLAELPAAFDPFRENGDFDTSVRADRLFAKSIDRESEAVVDRDGFVFCGLVPA